MRIVQPSRVTPLTAGLVRLRRGCSRRTTFLSADPDESDLRRHEDLHRLACEAGRTGSWYVRLDDQACTLSAMAASLLGLPAQELTIPAEIWRARIDGDHLPDLEKVVLSALAEDSPFEFEFRVSREARDYWLYLRGEIVRDATGKPVRIHGAIVDLTDHKRAKDELQHLAETLELRVEERTEELVKAQEALRQSQKLEAMGQLTGGIAHDFNNLLTPILANLDLLSQDVAGEREQRLIDGALKSAASAQILVQRLLAFARRQSLQPTCVDVGALIDAMADLIGRTVGPRISVVIDAAADLGPARADPNQLEMAILNLGVNARDAMPDGGTLTISAADETVAPGQESGLAPGPYVRLSIIDTGVGMDEATRRRAVEPFFSTKGVGKGTGLGLSMVDGLVSQMGGGFCLSSEPGTGTTATLWIPAWTEPAIAPSPAPAPAAAAAHSGVALVVDDHDIVRASTAEMLASMGFEVVEAASGEAAAEQMIGGLHVDLLVTDHLMPGMNGVDLAMLARGQFPDLPILLVSGHSDPAVLPSGLHCLAKPFRKAQLEARLAQFEATCLRPDEG